MPTDSTRLDELLGNIADLIGDNPQTAREFALRMQDHDGTKPVAEVLFKRGLSKRTVGEAARITELEDEVKTLKSALDQESTKFSDELAAAKAEVTELRSKEPNWERRVQETERRWQKKLDEATNETLAERRARINDLIEIEKQKFLGALGLGREGGVEAEWGRDVLPHRYADRFVASEDGKSVRVLEIGDTAAYDPQDGEPAVQLARDVLAKVPPKYRIMGTAEPGGGVSGGTGLDKGTAAVMEQKARTGLYQL
jgi:hypothetical protein